MSLKAYGDIIIIEEEIEKHDIFVLSTKNKTGVGVVISAGEKCTQCKDGDRVYYGEGQPFKHDGKEYVAIREQHVMGVFE